MGSGSKIVKNENKIKKKYPFKMSYKVGLNSFGMTQGEELGSMCTRARVRQNGLICVMEEPLRLSRRREKIDNRVTNGRDKVQKPDVVHTKGLTVMLPKKAPV